MLRINLSSKNIFNTNIPKEVAATAENGHRSNNRLLQGEFFLTPHGEIISSTSIKGRVMSWLGLDRCDPVKLGKFLVAKLGKDHPNTLYFEESGQAIIDQDKEQLKRDVKKAFDAFESSNLR